MLAYQWLATRATVAETMRSAKRSVSRIRAPSQLRDADTSPLDPEQIIGQSKAVVQPFHAKLRVTGAPTKKFSTTTPPSCMMAICGAFLVNVNIQGNSSRLMLSSRRRTAASEGFGCVEAVLQGFALSPPIVQCPATGEAGRAGHARKVGQLHVVRVQPDAVCYEHCVLAPVLVEVPSPLVAVLEEQIFCFA